jgi:hypothetical protein
MYNTSLGIQCYPMDLCLRRDNLEPEYARQHGVDYMDRLYLNPHMYLGNSCLLQHNGVVYFGDTRYNNEQGDFSNWALSMLNVEYAFYKHMWLDCVNQFIKTLVQHLYGIANQVQDDMPMETMAARWKYLEHLLRCNKCMDAGYKRSGTDAHRDQMALFLLSTGSFAVYNNLIRADVDHFCVSNGADWSTEQYLQQLIPLQFRNQDVRLHVQEDETQLVTDIHHLLDVATYMTGFARWVGPRVGPTTDKLRECTLRIYLGSGCPLLMFAPSWKQAYGWTPSLASVKTGIRMPHVNLTHNHRFHLYLDYLNTRAMFYQPGVWVDGGESGDEAQDMENDNDEI